jgi:hypothetical protein
VQSASKVLFLNLLFYAWVGGIQPAIRKLGILFARPASCPTDEIGCKNETLFLQRGCQSGATFKWCMANTFLLSLLHLTNQTKVDGLFPSIDPSFTVTSGMGTINRMIVNWEDP